jgi:hypothetical protein
MCSKPLNVALFLMAAASFLPAEIVGKFSYKGAPEDLNGDTINVSDTMVAMSENVRVETFMTLGDTVADTPSVFFVIDNSGSMNGTGSPATDRLGNRFTVTSAFIDTLRNNFPKVEVGVAVFGSWLYFDPNDSAYFVKPTGRPPSQDSGAYVPLLQLDRVYSQYGSRTGYDILKAVLDTTLRGTGGNQYVDLTYQPTNTVLRGIFTNITAGFDAARHAFRSSFNANRKNKQFIIFLSDGVANRPQSADSLRFVRGDTTATTFTVYFTTGGGGVPASISTMTANIRNNGYSTSNQKSTYWGYQNTGFDQLMNLLMDSVFTVIATNRTARPTRISIGSQSEVNWGVDSSFTFGGLFPLKGRVTPFTYVINYRLSINGRAVQDTAHIVKFYVRTVPGAVMNTSLYDVKYWDRSLMFRHNNAPITLIDGTMDSVELRFGYFPGTAAYDYTNVMVDVMNTSAAVSDREFFLLTRIGATDSFSFMVPMAVSASPVSSNYILEHAAPDDTIVAVFRNSENPRLPLDTLLISCPVHIDPDSLGALLDSAVTRDLDGDGLIDRIDLFFNKPVTIDSNDTGRITIRNVNNPDFSAYRISPLSGASYAVYVHEFQTNQQNPVPQTGWKPLLTIRDISGVENVTDFLTTDGCPPVVWRAVKRIVSQNLCQDTVSVYLSEKITGAGGSSFSASNSPQLTFAAWKKDVNDTFNLDTVLSGINSFARIVNDSILIFSMYRPLGGCLDLNSDYWINLQSQNPTLFDRKNNAPAAENRKCRIIVEGSSIGVVVPVNPAGPSTRYVQTPVLEFKNTPQALQWVTSGPGSGVVVLIQGLTIPEVDADKVKGYITIYDQAGNTVNWGSNDRLFDGTSSLDRDGFVQYWNGLNRKGMIVAPGIYRMVIYVDYPGTTGIKDIKKTAKIGMRR